MLPFKSDYYLSNSGSHTATSVRTFCGRLWPLGCLLFCLSCPFRFPGEFPICPPYFLSFPFRTLWTCIAPRSISPSPATNWFSQFILCYFCTTMWWFLSHKFPKNMLSSKRTPLSLLILVSWVFIRSEYFSYCLNNCRANVMKSPAINEGIQGRGEANQSVRSCANCVEICRAETPDSRNI